LHILAHLQCASVLQPWRNDMPLHSPKRKMLCNFVIKFSIVPSLQHHSVSQSIPSGKDDCYCFCLPGLKPMSWLESRRFCTKQAPTLPHHQLHAVYLNHHIDHRWEARLMLVNLLLFCVLARWLAWWSLFLKLATTCSSCCMQTKTI
jgi:hypothetical protein